MAEENLLKQLRVKIEEMLDECSPEDTPTVCNFISTTKGRQRIVQLIEKKVITESLAIGEAINSIELEYNSNLT